MTMRYHYGLAVGHVYAHGAEYSYPTSRRYPERDHTVPPGALVWPCDHDLEEDDEESDDESHRGSGDEGDDDAGDLGYCLYS